ncbi:MAG: muconolactone Delta-isomerase family protein [Actinomycetota bacterium]
MNGYMVVCTFKQGTVMADVYDVIAEEQAKGAELQKAGKIGSIYLATLSRGTVFIETFATSAEEATAIVTSLPMAHWWDIDVFPLSAPGKPGESA